MTGTTSSSGAGAGGETTTDVPPVVEAVPGHGAGHLEVLKWAQGAPLPVGQLHD